MTSALEAGLGFLIASSGLAELLALAEAAFDPIAHPVGVSQARVLLALARNL